LFLSALILVVIGLQASTFVTGTKIWPFMAYCMYSDSHGPGTIAASKYRTVAQTASGETLDVNVELTGLLFFALKERYLSPLRQGDIAAARNLADRINRRRQDPVVAFRVETERYEMTPEGIISSQTVTVFPAAD
jgi:hypothetical protein